MWSLLVLRVLHQVLRKDARSTLDVRIAALRRDSWTDVADHFLRPILMNLVARLSLLRSNLRLLKLLLALGDERVLGRLLDRLVDHHALRYVNDALLVALRDHEWLQRPKAQPLQRWRVPHFGPW